MARSRGSRVHRSAGTGRFVKGSTARRHRSTTTTERVGRGTANKRTVHRSAGTGKFVSKATARRHPGKTISQKV
jgi:hypothetical protein